MGCGTASCLGLVRSLNAVTSSKGGTLIKSLFVLDFSGLGRRTSRRICNKRVYAY